MFISLKSYQYLKSKEGITITNVINKKNRIIETCKRTFAAEN